MSEEMYRPLAMHEYVYNAMAKANYQLLKDGSIYADIAALCPGVWATGETVEECRDALQMVLSEWLTSVYEEKESLLQVPELAWLSMIWHKTRG